MEDREEGVRVIIGKDFNARTGREGGRVEMEKGGEEKKEKRENRGMKL